MAFDRTNPTQLAELQSELTNDPISMGYSQISSAAQLSAIISDPDDNVGNDTTGADFTKELVLQVIEPDDLTVGGQFTQGELEWVSLMMAGDADISQFKAKFSGLFQANTDTVNNLNAQVMAISRAEVLWGLGSIVSKQDILAAQG